MTYTYWLPNETGQKVEYSTEDNAVIIIGANGSGKSKLGAWIEQQDFERVHRIGAQRNLNFNENIQLKSYSAAEDLVFYGTDKSDQGLRREKGMRWNFGKEYTTKLIEDFENVLSAIIGLNNQELEIFFNKCRYAEIMHTDKPHTPTTAIEKLIKVWNTVLSQRQLTIHDSKFEATINTGDNLTVYSPTQMSDGERAVLYLAAQVLSVRPNKILIIDEPEIHLHRSIMNRLWKVLEEYRKDCLFIYITHDTQFAVTHGFVDKIWLKEYDGTNWKLEILEKDEYLPEELLMDILGSRKNVLFVEGEKGSYDYQLYTLLYPDYLIIPCGGCAQVIARTKAFKANSGLHNYQVYGLIDRDYRSGHEIEAYKKDNIYTLEVAEVENLFLVEELIRVLAERFGANPDDAFAQVKKFVVETKFSNMINQQITQSSVAEVKYQLSQLDISGNNDADIKTRIDSLSFCYDTTKINQEAYYREVLKKGDYKTILRVFNEKSLSKNIGIFLGYDNRKYQQAVINLLRTDSAESIVKALEPYLPPEIPRMK